MPSQIFLKLFIFYLYQENHTDIQQNKKKKQQQYESFKNYMQREFKNK